MGSSRLEIVIEHDAAGVAPDPFFAIVRATLELLKGTEHIVSGDSSNKGTWRISKISLQSPLHLTLEKFTENDIPDFSAGIDPLMGDIKRLDTGKPVKYLTPELQLRAKSIVGNFHQGVVGIIYRSNGTEARLTQRIAASVDESVGKRKKHIEIGSIEGRLEVISIHNTEVITVWDVRFSTPVQCHLGPHQLDEAKELLGSRVRVRGVINYRKRRPYAVVDVFDIREFRSAAKLPQPDDLEAIDLFGNIDPVDYLRDGSDASN